MTDNNSKDDKFHGRIRSAIATVEAWDADPMLLAECRLMIPFEEIMTNDKYKRDEEDQYHGNALFLKRLTVFFQTDVMTWVNQPPCLVCNSTENLKNTTTRGPETVEEREGQATRVEVYACQSCPNQPTTTFPRYNSVRKLLETRKGRCGEYANLYGLYCRAAGFETRYVSDWTDHVWVEVLVDNDDWIMADGCEGMIDTPSMYEDGWGKKLNYIVGVTKDSVVDVTPRYTRKFHDSEFQQRRRGITTSDAASDGIIARCNASLRSGLSKPRVEELERRAKREQGMLNAYKKITEWTEQEKHGRGRISGSLEWKVSRQEDGMASKEQDDEASSSVVRSLYVEQFLPDTGTTVEITVHPQTGILVCGANCEQPGCISTVVVDHVNLGCILQCRSFASWADLADFVPTIPPHRIVVLKAAAADVDVSDAAKKKLNMLGGFTLPDDKSGVVFIGQVEAHPDWAVCKPLESTGFTVELPVVAKNGASVKLRTERDTVPTTVAGRIPESVMPLQTQLLASEAQKRAAFQSYATTDNVRGYVSKEGCPIYLLRHDSFPFQHMDGWNTFHFLPEALVPDNDKGAIEPNSSNDEPKFDIPVDEDFFSSLLGPQLLQKASGGSLRGASPPSQATGTVLKNSRLVGLYFSGHWCGPCRRFTPMLIEAYNHLKEEFPSHGLEIVFVSSDRSDPEFNQYYATMPWAAAPFNRMQSQAISQRYGVRGIPAFVILDAMSGQIVSTVEQSRKEVVQACQRGDEGIEEMLKSWLNRIPNESKELMNMLEMSVEQDGEDIAATTERTEHSYLVRSESTKAEPAVDAAAQVKEIFAKLVAQGEAPNTAAAKAIKLVSEGGASFDKGPLKAGSLKILASDDNNGKTTTADLMTRIDKDVCLQTLRLLQKYLANAAREPWNPKFRSMKLSNKIVDRVARVEGVLGLMESFGLTVMAAHSDYIISIPLALDLDSVCDSVSEALKSSE